MEVAKGAIYVWIGGLKEKFLYYRSSKPFSQERSNNLMLL
jgi:hypothetical protein